MIKEHIANTRPSAEDTSLPSKSTLTSNPKPATLDSTSTDPSKAAVLLPESEEEKSRETPTNLLTTADKQKSLPSEVASTESKPLTFSKSDPATGTESLEEKASGVKGTTGFDEKSADNTTTTGTTTGTTTTGVGSTTAPPLTGAPAKKEGDGLREENVGSSGLLEEKRVKPESASEPKVGETSTSATTSTPKKSTSSEGKKSLDGSGSGHDKEKKSLKEKIKEKLHRHKD